MAGLRAKAKQTEIWDWDLLVEDVIFDLVVFKVIWVPFGSVVSKWTASPYLYSKNGLKFRT